MTSEPFRDAGSATFGPTDPAAVEGGSASTTRHPPLTTPRRPAPPRLSRSRDERQLGQGRRTCTARPRPAVKDTAADAATGGGRTAKSEA